MGQVLNLYPIRAVNKTKGRSMNTNSFELLGRVGHIDIDYRETGTVVTTISLGLKNSKGEYENFYITFLNTKKLATAEQLADEVKEGDYIRVNGSLTMNKYTPQGSDKPKFSLRLMGWGYKKVQWNSTKKAFEDVEIAE